MLKFKGAIATRNILVCKDGVFEIYSFPPDSAVDDCIRGVIIDEVGEEYFTEDDLDTIVKEIHENGDYHIEYRRFFVELVEYDKQYT